jgi:hypothetical protein
VGYNTHPSGVHHGWRRHAWQTWTSLTGVTIEILWRYWVREGGKRKGHLLWAEGDVVEVAAAQATQIPKQIRDMLENKPQYRAVKMRWPEDKEFEEKERYQWSILKPEDWNGDGHMSWRYAPCELAKRRAMHSARKLLDIAVLLACMCLSRSDS